MRYFIRRTPEVAEQRLLGPYDSIRVLEKARELRDNHIEFFITDEAGVVIVHEAAIRRSRFE
jgi:hypothetical protein